MTLFLNFLMSVPIPRERCGGGGGRGARAPEQLPTPSPGSTRAANAEPRASAASPRNAFRPGARSGGPRSWAPPPPPRRDRARRTPAPPGPSGTTVTHGAHLGGTPTPGCAGPGRAGRTTPPAKGHVSKPRRGGGPAAKQGREGGRAAGASGLRRAARPLPESESPAPCFHPQLRRPPRTPPGSLPPPWPAHGERPRPRSAQKLRPPGEGRTRRRDRGGARRAAPLAPPPRAATLRSQLQTS